MAASNLFFSAKCFVFVRKRILLSHPLTSCRNIGLRSIQFYGWVVDISASTRVEKEHMHLLNVIMILPQRPEDSLTIVRGLGMDQAQGIRRCHHSTGRNIIMGLGAAFKVGMG